MPISEAEKSRKNFHDRVTSFILRLRLLDMTIARTFVFGIHFHIHIRKYVVITIPRYLLLLSVRLEFSVVFVSVENYIICAGRRCRIRRHGLAGQTMHRRTNRGVFPFSDHAVSSCLLTAFTGSYSDHVFHLSRVESLFLLLPKIQGDHGSCVGKASHRVVEKNASLAAR